MKTLRLTITVSIAALLVACGAPDASEGMLTTTGTDPALADGNAQGDGAPTSPSSDANRSDAGGTVVPDSSPTRDATPASDAGRDATAGDTGPEAQPPVDAGVAADGGTPEASAPEAGPPVDATATDGARPTDGATVDRSAIVDAARDATAPVCPADGAACESVNWAIADIRRTFPDPCAPENFRRCGGVVAGRSLEAGQYVVITHPLECRGGAWTLAGVWTGNFWSPLFECSKGCAAEILCAP